MFQFSQEGSLLLSPVTTTLPGESPEADRKASADFVAIAEASTGKPPNTIEAESTATEAERIQLHLEVEERRNEREELGRMACSLRVYPAAYHPLRSVATKATDCGSGT